MSTMPWNSMRPHRDGPQVDEDDLHVEGHEEQGVEVEGQPEAAPGVTDGVDARTRTAGPSVGGAADA